MRISIIIALFIILIGCIILSFLASQQMQGNISKALQIVSGLSSFLTLLIAFLLFNRFGIERALLEKQTNAVISLFEAAKRLRLILDSDDSLMLFTVNREKFKSLLSDQMASHPLLFEYNYLKILKDVDTAIESVFMPITIAQQFIPLRPNLFNVSRTIPSKGYTFVDALDTPVKEGKEHMVPSTIKL